MNNSTPNSDRNETDKELSKIKRAFFRLKIILIILAILVLAMAVTLCIQLTIFLSKINLLFIRSNKYNTMLITKKENGLGKSNSANETNIPEKSTTSSNHANTTKNCENLTVGKYCDGKST